MDAHRAHRLAITLCIVIASVTKDPTISMRTQHYVTRTTLSQCSFASRPSEDDQKDPQKGHEELLRASRVYIGVVPRRYTRNNNNNITLRRVSAHISGCIIITRVASTRIPNGGIAFRYRGVHRGRHRRLPRVTVPCAGKRSIRAEGSPLPPFRLFASATRRDYFAVSLCLRVLGPRMREPVIKRAIIARRRPPLARDNNIMSHIV